MDFSVLMYGYENWAIKKAEHWSIDVFQLLCWRRLLRVLYCKEIQPVYPKGNQCWIFIGRTDAEPEAPILWPLDLKNWLIWKDPDARKDWRQEEKGKTGWDGWMASPSRWTWTWVSSRSWWWIGKPGMLQSMALQRDWHYWRTELNWTNWEQRLINLIASSWWLAAHTNTLLQFSSVQFSQSVMSDS